MKAFELYHRVLAAASYNVAKGNMAEAVKMFSTLCNALALKLPADHRKFIQRWGEYYNKHNTVQGNNSNSGRKPKPSQGEAELLVADLMNWAKFGLKGPFTSITQLKKTSSTAKAILQQVNITTKTIISTLRKIEPKLAYKKLTVKQALTQLQKAARLRVARRHITVNQRTLECVVWVDAKTMYMTIKTRCGWIRLDDEVPFTTTRPASKKNPITLRYYIGVCGRAGAVFLVFYTGTTGMPADRDPGNTYPVSSACVKLACCPSFSISNGLVDHGLPALAASTCITR